MRRTCSGIGWMAERSKALVSGTSLFGGEGSNPSSVTMSRLAQLVERKTLNLVVVGSSPTVGVTFLVETFCQWKRKATNTALISLLWRSWQRVGLIILRSRVRSSPGAGIFLQFFFFGGRPWPDTGLRVHSGFQKFEKSKNIELPPWDSNPRPQD